MNNKKKLIIAGSLAAFLAVGGTAAFFTSSDSIANVFNTGKGTDNPDDLNAGVDVEEDFKPLGDGTTSTFTDSTTGEEHTFTGGTNPNRPATDYDDGEGENNTTENGGGYGEVPDDEKVIDQVLPGEAFTKKMNIGSNVDYAQYLRAKIVITIKDDKGVEVEPSDTDRKALIVQLNDAELAKNWTEDGDYYYYNYFFQPGEVTQDLVKAVALAPSAGNWWKGKTINVEVHAEGVQATTDAWAVEWENPTIAKMPEANNSAVIFKK